MTTRRLVVPSLILVGLLVGAGAAQVAPPPALLPVNPRIGTIGYADTGLVGVARDRLGRIARPADGRYVLAYQVSNNSKHETRSYRLSVRSLRGGGGCCGGPPSEEVGRYDSEPFPLPPGGFVNTSARLDLNDLPPGDAIFAGVEMLIDYGNGPEWTSHQMRRYDLIAPR